MLGRRVIISALVISLFFLAGCGGLENENISTSTPQTSSIGTQSLSEPYSGDVSNVKKQVLSGEASSKTVLETSSNGISKKSADKESTGYQNGKKISGPKSKSKKGKSSHQKKSTSSSGQLNVSSDDPNTVTISLSIDCINAYNAGNDIAAKISDKGIMFPESTVTLKAGASVYEALKEAERQNPKLLVGARTTPMGVYVYSIGSLAEKAVGGQSGWLFIVNGKVSHDSSSSYILSDNDKVCWRYTVNGGGDVG